MKSCLVIIFAIFMLGCSGSKSKTTNTNSAALSTLAEKKEFLERYVNFRRIYDELNFTIKYTDGNNGMVPSPSEWDIRFMAKVPKESLDEWIKGLKETDKVNTDWISTIPNAPTDLSDFKWYGSDRELIGISRAKSLVLYRNLAY